MAESIATPTANPVHVEKDVEMLGDRATFAVLRATEEADGRCLRSVIDIMLALNPTSEMMVIACSITILQLIVSCMITAVSISEGIHGKPSYENIITFCASSLAIATSVNKDCVEFFANNRCIEMLKAEKKDVCRKDTLITLSFLAKFALFIATVVSITQQPNPVGIITNCTGLLMINTLDTAVFDILQLPFEVSHDIKNVMKEVKVNPTYSPRAILLMSWTILMAATLIISNMTK
jgi:hypothetical protein